MCGRFLISATPDAVASRFGLASAPDLPPRWNVAPGQNVPTVRSSRHGERTLSMMQWGLIPHWAKDPGIGHKLINARAETAATKASFRAPLKSHRCLIVTDGFYEWQQVDGRKQPWCIRAVDDSPFAMAGLWACWRGGDDPIETFTILTTAPNATVKPIHNRMPVIVSPENYNLWLDPLNTDVGSLQDVLAPAADDLLHAFAVSRHVNRPANDDPECIRPIDT